NVNTSLLNRLFSSDTELINGDASFNLQYAKKNSRGMITGFVTIPEGSLERFPFENFQLRLGTEESINKSAAPDENNAVSPVLEGLYIENVTLTTERGLNVTGKGFLSFFDDYISDFDIYLNGNILSIFTDVDPFFTYSDGEGKAYLKITGSLTNPEVYSGTISIQNSSLYLSSVINKIENITFDAALKEDSRFIKINNLTATIDGKQAQIQNSESIVITDGETQHMFEQLELMDDGLNLGILSFHTSNKGLDLFIPGMIEKGETATMSISGLHDDEQFWLAGPVE
ncbi:unnamed protein product, partial [marine sediment metagenome]